MSRPDFNHHENLRPQVKRAIQLRDIVTSLGPAYIKLGQALSIRPDILSPAAMNELQKLCDKVPSFDNGQAMAVLEAELGAPWQQVGGPLHTPETLNSAPGGSMLEAELGAHWQQVGGPLHSPAPKGC